VVFDFLVNENSVVMVPGLRRDDDGLTSALLPHAGRNRRADEMSKW
jgi:hypothetical protein